MDDGNNFVDREDGQTYNKNDIGITGYEITGIKYVPVAVRAQDYAQFVEDYDVTLNGETMYGGYSEKYLSAYAYTAEVTANTNGLKTATLTDGAWSFSARKTGTGSGLKDQELAVFSTEIEQGVVEYSGKFGEFLRYDITGTGYGDIGSAMQTVKWTYYGTDSTYTTPVATYGTKFAADDWMHSSMGVQLGLTDSIRCQLPADTDGTGYWTITIYGLGAQDYTAKFEVTADNLPKKVELMTEEQKTKLTALKDEAAEILAKYDDETVKTTPDLSTLKAHYDEAVALLANADATVADADELLGELPGLIEAAKALTPATETYTGTATVKNDEDNDDEWADYDITAVLTVTDGVVTDVAIQGTVPSESETYYKKAVDGTKKYTGLVEQVKSKNIKIAEISSLDVDAVSGATYTSNAIIAAIKGAAKAS